MAKGGPMPGSGRPTKSDEEKIQRPQHQVRAFPEEWEIIREFSRIVKKNPERAKRMMQTE